MFNIKSDVHRRSFNEVNFVLSLFKINIKDTDNVAFFVAISGHIYQLILLTLGIIFF